VKGKKRSGSMKCVIDYQLLKEDSAPISVQQLNPLLTSGIDSRRDVTVLPPEVGVRFETAGSIT
jgi:hypothetical protein